MSDEIKYCKFCNKEKPIKEFVKSGFAIKNICRECQNKKQAQIYRDSKKVKELEKENQELKKQLHEASLEIQHLIEQDIDCPSSCNKLRKLRNQQKEFIEWLEDKLNMCDGFLDTIKSDLEEISYAGRTSGKTYIATQIMKNETAMKCYEEVLSKYKEIIGGDNK